MQLRPYMPPAVDALHGLNIPIVADAFERPVKPTSAALRKRSGFGTKRNFERRSRTEPNLTGRRIDTPYRSTSASPPHSDQRSHQAARFDAGRARRPRSAPGGCWASFAAVTVASRSSRRGTMLLRSSPRNFTLNDSASEVPANDRL
jgi:hypothetical protein